MIYPDRGTFTAEEEDINCRCLCLTKPRRLFGEGREEGEGTRAFKDRQFRLSPSLPRLPSDGELGMVAEMDASSNVFAATCVCLRADRQTTAGWMPILHIYNYNYRSDMVAATDITFSSVIKMGKYSPTSRFSFPPISPKLAPLFRAFRVIRALFCTPPAAYVVLRLLRSSSSVIFGVDNDTAGSAILLPLPLPPRLNFFLVHLTHICPHLSWDRRCRGKI